MTRQQSLGVLVLAVLGAGGLIGALLVTVRILRAPSDSVAGRSSAMPILEIVSPRKPAIAHDKGYVGSHTCAECHAVIAEAFAKHPMANSLYPVADAPTLEDYSARVEFTTPRDGAAGEYRYRVERSGPDVWHHELLIGGEGQIIYDQRAPVHYAVGSGTSGRTYLIDRGGVFYESPITWYSQPGEWGLSPGYLPGRHHRFERRITDDCLSCHAGRTAHSTEAPNHFGIPPFLESSIGCERCHGPGERHVNEARSRAAGAAATDYEPTIVNPARLDSARRDAVCNQCHLHGEYRQPRAGRTEYTFRPGERLEDNWVLLVKGSGIGQTGEAHIVSQVEQMRASVCFAKSQGALNCTSCHNPHSVPAAADQEIFYRKKCLKCHTDKSCSIDQAERHQTTSGDACTVCHMPRLSTVSISHVSQTDHRVPRRPSVLDGSGAPEVTELFDRPNNSLPQSELIRAQALRAAQHAKLSPQPQHAERAARLLSRLLPEAKADAEVLRALGLSHLILRNWKQGEDWLLRAAVLEPGHETAWEGLAKAYAAEGNLPAARHAFEQYLALNPWVGKVYVQYAQVLEQAGDLSAAAAAGERALELSPDLAPVHAWLASVYLKLDDREASVRHQQQFQNFTAE